MDLRKELSGGNSKKHITRIVEKIGDDQDSFDELIDLFLNGEYRIVQKAAWVLSCSVENNPSLIKKHLKRIILNLKKTDSTPVKRNTVRLLQFINIPDSLQGITWDLCFKLLTTKSETVAVKVFSMTVLFNLTQNEAVLAKELAIAIEDQIQYETAAFKSRGGKILKKLGRPVR